MKLCFPPLLYITVGNMVLEFVVSSYCLVRNLIVFFYSYVYEGYYENNVDR